MSYDYEMTPFGTIDIKFDEEESEPRLKYEPVDWDAIGDNERRCKNCERFREERGYGDFICKHTKGYAEVPAHVRRCHACDRWRNEKGIEGDFWCGHNKHRKEEWDTRRGWEGASERAQEIMEWRRMVRDAR